MMKLFYSTRNVLFIALVARMFGIITYGDPVASFQNIRNNGFKDQLLRVCSVNNDEIIIAEVALNHNNGLSYASSKESGRAGYIYDFTAYRPSYPVYVHIFLMKVYSAIYDDDPFVLSRMHPYFIMYAFLLHCISFFLFGISLVYFKKASLFFLPETWASIALLFYGLHPSIILFVGNLANYESLTTSLLIINVSILLKALKEKLRKSDYFIFICCFIVSVLFRPQQGFIYLFAFGFYLSGCFINRHKDKVVFLQAVKLIGICAAAFIFFNIPVLIKNYRLFNGITLTTTGFNFSQGHNPYARGSWCGTCGADTTSAYYLYVRENIPRYNEMNEYEKSTHIQQLAMRWIEENPLGEIVLSVRKLAIYFLPYNNDHNIFNPLNLIFHTGTLLYCMLIVIMLFKKRLSVKYALLGAPLAGSIAVTLIFHVGYRWRFYAEPFMVIMTFVYILEMMKWIRERKKLPNALN